MVVHRWVDFKRHKAETGCVRRLEQLQFTLALDRSCRLDTVQRMSPANPGLAACQASGCSVNPSWDWADVELSSQPRHQSNGEDECLLRIVHVQHPCSPWWRASKSRGPCSRVLGLLSSVGHGPTTTHHDLFHLLEISLVCIRRS